MAVPIIFIRRLTRITGLLLCLPFTVQAEFGVGIVEEPFTGKVTYDVEKDWQEGIVFHPETGNYIVTYKDAYASFNSLVFEPATKIEPALKSRFTRSDNGAVRYGYELKNGKGAKQNIDSLWAAVTSISPGGPMAPPNWNGSAAPSIVVPGLRLAWTYDGKEERGGLAPGKAIRGFVADSNDLPGIAIMEITGAATGTTWYGHVPSIDTEVGKQLYEIEKNNFLRRLAAVPTIVVPTPYDGAVVLDNLRTHITQDITALRLIEPTFAATLNRSLQAAADAIRHNQAKAARDHLHDALTLLHKAHRGLDKDDDQGDRQELEDNQSSHGKNASPIDRLAARVIAFDLKYVVRRIGGRGQ